MKIGDAIRTIERSESEGNRILNSISSGTGKPFEIFNTYAKRIRDQSLWASAHKRLQIKGFRPGKANDLVLSRVIRGIHDSDRKVEPIFWSLYIPSVVTYLNIEHSNLNKLLLEKNIEGDSSSTDNIVKEIIKYIASYEVDTSQIEDLYESWWFERSDNLHELFANQELNITVVKEIISKSENRQLIEIERLRKKISKLELESSKHERELEFERGLVKLTTQLEGLKSDFDLELTKFEKKYLEDIEGKITEIQNNIEKEKITEAEEIDPELKSKISEHEKNINTLNRKIEKLEEHKNEKHKSIRSRVDIFKSSNILKQNLSKITENSEFSETHFELLKLVLNSFNCYYIESDIFFRAVTQEALKEGNVKELIATPAMIDVPAELFSELEGYDLIYLKNISSCFIEGFILPLLLKSSSLVEPGFPKIFILHDSEVNSTTISKIKRHTLEMNTEWILSLLGSEILSPIERIDAFQIEEISPSQREFRQVFNNSGIEIEHQVFDNFVRLSNILKPFVGEENGIHLSAEGTVFQYIRSCYGETKSQVAIDLFKDIFVS